MKPLGIYVHIPFCQRKCNYCDFCSASAGAATKSLYVDSLMYEIAFEHTRDYLSSYKIDSIFFGGGTPTLMPVRILENILCAIRDSGEVTADAEITVECNPATADRAYLAELREMGVNRLSIGLQSIHENELKALGRAHSLSDFERTFSDARLVGFDNISVDLMYGIPHQSLKSFEESICYLARLSPEHISAYGLKIEKGTPFYSLRESLILPDEDEEFEEYLALSRILSSYGYEKYEISNFSKPQMYSRHNLRYWKQGEYLGFGVAAHSYFLGERFGASRDIESFLLGKDIIAEREQITEDDAFREYVMLSLRLTDGIDLNEFTARAGRSFFDFYPRAYELERQGYFKIENGRIFFTDKGFFVSSTILSDMLDFS